MLRTCQGPDFQRADLRLALDIEVVVVQQGKAVTARLHDLSRGGAALSALRPPARDTAVTVRFEKVAIGGRVAWTAGRRFGLSFDVRLRATDVFRISNRSRAGAMVQPWPGPHPHKKEGRRSPGGLLST